MVPYAERKEYCQDWERRHRKSRRKYLTRKAQEYRKRDRTVRAIVAGTLPNGWVSCIQQVLNAVPM